MNQKHKILNRYTVSALAVLILTVAAFTVFIIKPGSSQAEATAKASSTESAKLQFSFTGVAGWVQGPANKTSMALFHGDSIAQPAADGCFTSAEYKTGTIDVGAALQKQQASLAMSGGSMTPETILTVAIRTNTGDRQYRLHQYSLTGGSSEKLMGGLELGYVQLAGVI